MIHREKDRVNHDFIVMANEHIYNKKLSFLAVGLLTYMLSMPDEYKLCEEDIINLSRSSPTETKAALYELMEQGYVVQVKMFNKDGNFCGSEFNICETQHVLSLIHDTQNMKVVKRQIKTPKGRAPKRKKQYDQESEPYKLAVLFYSKVACLINSEPDLDSWASTFDKFIKLTGNKFDRITQMINFFQDDNWNKYHILSAPTFCRKWDDIWNKFCYIKDRDNINNKRKRPGDNISALDDMIKGS